MRRELLLSWLLVATAAVAAEGPAPDEGKKEDETPELPAGGSLRPRPEPEPRLKTTERVLLSPAPEVDASEAMDEMIDELAADVARLGAARVSPMLIERVRLSDNINPEFAAIVEARLAAALSRAANVSVQRCMECWATRARVDGNEWVVTHGLTRKEDLQAVARKYEAKTLLSVSLSLHTAPNSLAMDVELVRAEDSAIVYAESFRVHPHTALLYRGVDHAQAREAQLEDLQARLEARPQYGHGAIGGSMMVPGWDANGPIWGAYMAYRLYEKFGPAREYRMGLSAGGFLNAERLAGALLTIALQKRVTEENAYSPSLYIGGSAGAFITGQAGNTPLFAFNLEYQLVHRFALQASLAYLVPFELGRTGTKVGGVSPELGVAIVW